MSFKSVPKEPQCLADERVRPYQTLGRLGTDCSNDFSVRACTPAQLTTACEMFCVNRTLNHAL